MIGFCFTFGPTFLPWPFRSLGDQASGGTSLCHATLTVHGRTTKQPWKNGAKRRMSWRKYGAQGFGGNGMICIWFLYVYIYNSFLMGMNGYDRSLHHSLLSTSKKKKRHCRLGPHFSQYWVCLKIRYTVYPWNSHWMEKSWWTRGFRSTMKYLIVRQSHEEKEGFNKIQREK